MVQERLIEKYMSLPNEIWDSIIQRATVVSHPLHMYVVANNDSGTLCVNNFFNLQAWEVGWIHGNRMSEIDSVHIETTNHEATWGECLFASSIAILDHPPILLVGSRQLNITVARE